MTEPPSQASDSALYWCYHCDKSVSIVQPTQNPPDIKCIECNSGFVQCISSTSDPPSSLYQPSGSPDPVDDPNFGSQFLDILRLIAHSARDDDSSPPPPPNRSPREVFLRIEIGGWDHDEDDNDDDDQGRVEDGDNEDPNREDNEQQENRREIEDDPLREHLAEQENEDDLRTRTRQVLRYRIRDLPTRTRTGRNRILDWAEALMGLEDHSIEFRLQVPESDQYMANPEDYVDEAAYDVLLQTLAESDGGVRKGAPPAAKSAVSALPTVLITTEEDAVVCAICKDMLAVGETAKKLPCGHEYHGDCIEPWLGSRNSCPVCRFELPTDDPDYEEERKNKVMAMAGGPSGSGRADSTSD